MTVLFVVLTIVLALAVDWLLHRGRNEVVAAAPAPASVRVPNGVFFARSHTWLNLFPSGHAWLGVDDFVVRLLDKPTVRFLVEPGAPVKRGAPLLSLEQGDRSLTVRAPIDGRVLAFNEALRTDPGLLQHSPFCEGWACDLRPDRYSDLKGLLLGDETRGWMEEEFGRLRDVFAGAGGEVEPAMLQDGGPPIAGAMKHVDGEVWKRFDHEFLEVR
jgi:glycine cleavage system H lipoate-binding protein